MIIYHGAMCKIIQVFAQIRQNLRHQSTPYRTPFRSFHPKNVRLCYNERKIHKKGGSHLQSLPIMSLVYFLLAIFWAIASVIAFGQALFWLFLIMVPLNIYAGIKSLQR